MEQILETNTKLNNTPMVLGYDLGALLMTRARSALDTEFGRDSECIGQ